MELLIPSTLPSGKLYALDTVALIYFLEKHPSYYVTAKTIFQKIESGEFSAVISSLVFAELLVPAFRSGETERAEKIVHILSHFPNLKVIPLSTVISVAAAKLRSVYKLRTPDAIHAATAMESGAQGLITNDKEIRKIATKNFGVWLFDASGNPDE
jgi:predicted nucleic acid-binding protein